jgi:hypothetical protein
MRGEIPVPAPVGNDGPPRFVSLSALPPEKRMPPRHDGVRPGMFVPRRLEPLSGAATTPSLKALALKPPSPTPTALEPAGFPRLGFNCPSCFTVLFIKNPAEYDGRAAPCPYCRAAILPPRMAPASPFILIADGSAPEALPAPRLSRWKPFKQKNYSRDSQAMAPAGSA